MVKSLAGCVLVRGRITNKASIRLEIATTATIA